MSNVHEVTIDGVRYVPATEEPQPLAPFEIVDVRDQVPYNHNPDGSAILRERSGWWKRTPSQIDGITIHHTMTNNWQATAAWTARNKANGGKGYPAIQYHYWVQADGTILYLLDVREGCWHDHCGDKNTHISIGMAGRLDIAAPPEKQLQAAAWLARQLAYTYGISVDNIDGHREWSQRCTGKYQTTCPGWHVSGWRDAFFNAFNEWGM